MLPQKNDLILITGGASGIGYGIATHCKKRGATVIIIDSDVNAIRKALADDPSLICFKVDVSQQAEVADIFKHLKKKFRESITSSTALVCVDLLGNYGLRLSSSFNTQ